MKIAVAGAKGRMGSRIIALLPEEMTLSSIEAAEVVIEFTSPAGAVHFAGLAAERRIPLVSGTTGLSADDEARLDEAAGKIPVLHAPNMSIGINLLCEILPRVAKVFGGEIEIVEAHHNQKKDSPSGTALLLKKVIGPDVPVHAIRGGDVVGDHTVHFLGQGERIEITHRATSRDTFALGAIRAARWIIGKPPGRYSMKDVLA